jgi:hypothetical protein
MNDEATSARAAWAGTWNWRANHDFAEQPALLAANVKERAAVVCARVGGPEPGHCLPGKPESDGGHTRGADIGRTPALCRRRVYVHGSGMGIGSSAAPCV